MTDKATNKLITHDGSFHTDDVFAAAALSLYLNSKGEAFEIIRTRDEAKIQAGDYVFDVGGIYNADSNRFDHHQPGGAGERSGIEYSSFGLVWRKFGAEIAGSDKAAEILDKKLAAPIDAGDNGQNLVENKSEITPYYLQHLFFAMRPTWREAEADNDAIFLKCVEIGRQILSREIVHTNDALLAEEKVVAAYEASADKRILVFDTNYPYEYVLKNFPEPLYVIYPKVQAGADGGLWMVKCVREGPKAFKNRKSLPQRWAGLRDEELQKVTGVPDAVFCHRALFLAGAKSKEGAIKLAELALEDNLKPKA